MTDSTPDKRGEREDVLARRAGAAEYDVMADALCEVADAAREAFIKAGFDPGEWDGDSIVDDVKRGLVSAIEQLAQLPPIVPPNKRPYSDKLAQEVIEGQVKEIDRLTKLVQDLRAAPSAIAPDDSVSVLVEFVEKHLMPYAPVGGPALDSWKKAKDAIAAIKKETQRAEGAPTHWVYAAAESHRPLVENMAMGDRMNEGKHIAWMLDQIPTMSPTKACRWLGWIQASLYVDGAANLDDLKELNRVASERHQAQGGKSDGR